LEGRGNAAEGFCHTDRGADSANNSIFRQKKSAPTVKQVREIGDSCQILETGTGISKTLSNKKYRNPLKDCGMYEAVSLVFVRRVCSCRHSNPFHKSPLPGKER
jgi:hypothetical protein